MPGSRYAGLLASSSSCVPTAAIRPSRSGATHGNVADSAANAHAAQLRELLEAGTAAGTFRLASPHATAVLLYNAMHGSAGYLVHVASDTDLVEAVIAESLCLCLCRPALRSSA